MRLLHRLYAKIFGYFWLPCPICWKEFGGHEVKSLGFCATVPVKNMDKVVCTDPRCIYEAGFIAGQKSTNHAA